MLAPIPIHDESGNTPPPLPARSPGLGEPTNPFLSGSPGQINMSPTPHDLGPSYSPRAAAYPVEPVESTSPNMPAGPTVAETGAPIVGTNGPVSGQLPNRKASLSSTTSSQAAAAVPGGYPSAADEKARLERAQVEHANAAGSSSSAAPVPIPSASAVQTQEELPSYSEGLPDDPEARARAEAQQIMAAERERKGGPL